MLILELIAETIIISLFLQARWERKQGKKNRRLVFHGSRSSSSLDRSVNSAVSGVSGGGVGGGGGSRARSRGQKIAFSRKFPFMKSRERLNRLDDEEDIGDDMGSESQR